MHILSITKNVELPKHFLATSEIDFEIPIYEIYLSKTRKNYNWKVKHISLEKIILPTYIKAL